MPRKIFLFCLGLLLMFPWWATGETENDLAVRLSGRILLQVESHGEAWYVNPRNNKRYYLGRPADAFNLMRSLGVGISNINLAKISVGVPAEQANDTDQDGIGDSLEEALGTNKNLPDTDGDGLTDKEELLWGYDPTGPGVYPLDSDFARRYKGYIFLQVESHGEAWYINPQDNKRYYLGRPADAFNLMRQLGLGITNKDLAKISIAEGTFSPPPSSPEVPYYSLEKAIFEAINKKRQKNSLPLLFWNEEVAQVARRHSEYLAKEDEALVPFSGIDGIDYVCKYPIIHHEGFEFGLYQNERLNSKGVYYFSASGENIALIPQLKNFQYESIAPLDCRNETLDEIFKETLEQATSSAEKRQIIEQEIVKRQEIIKRETPVTVVEKTYYTDEEVVSAAVEGWMNSPGHRANILNKQYNQTGVGIAKIGDYFIITQVFIKKVDCGYKGGVCCQTSSSYYYCYTPYRCSNNNNICQ